MKQEQAVPKRNILKRKKKELLLSLFMINEYQLAR